jgi:hypothetical protein
MVLDVAIVDNGETISVEKTRGERKEEDPA